MQSVVLKLHPDDNVLIALLDLHKGEKIDFSHHSLILTSDVPAKHKFVTEDLSPVLSYSCTASSWERPRSRSRKARR